MQQRVIGQDVPDFRLPARDECLKAYEADPVAVDDIRLLLSHQ